MKRENAKPGVEVILKRNNSSWIISDPAIQDGKVSVGKYADTTALYSFDPNDIRLANKPKRTELRARIEELEARVKDLKDQRDRYAKRAHDLLTGDYFNNHPQI